jgi:two-component system OmpR family sensor kinase
LRDKAAYRLHDMTLRTKLIAVVLALMTVAFVAVAAATTLALRHYLLGQLDQQLQAASTRFSVLLESPSDRDADTVRQFETVAGQSAGTLGARLHAGTVLAAVVIGRPGDPRGRVEPLGPADRAVLAAVPQDGSPASVHFPGLGEYRVVAVRGAGDQTLITGLPTGPVDHTIHDLVVIELVVYAVAVVVVGILGASLVRLTLRPLNRITDTAARVATLPLTTGSVSLSPDEPADEALRPPGDTEVGTLAAAFDQMLRNVEQSLAARHAGEARLRRFVSDASHELRTPVAVIRGHAELARTSDALPPDVEYALARIVGESERMSHIVDDLLLLARLNSGRELERSEVDLTRLVLDAVSDARAAGPDHRWQLDLPGEPVEVLGEQHALHQVLANLLSNARLHTPSGTTVLTMLQPANGGATITVADDGPGISPEVLPNIFERFVRGDDTRSATTGGSGLGLAIVDAIVRRHGGRTEVESKPADTRFVVHLP